MAPVTHAAALYSKTGNNPDPGLLPVRRLAGERDPQHPLGSHRSVSPHTAFTEGEIHKTQCCSHLPPWQRLLLTCLMTGYDYLLLTY